MQMTEEQAEAEALRLFIRKMRRLHPEAFGDVWMRLPEGARSALLRTETRADIFFMTTRSRGETLEYPAESEDSEEEEE